MAFDWFPKHTAYDRATEDFQIAWFIVAAMLVAWANKRIQEIT
jgi:hypothetical protein